MSKTKVLFVDRDGTLIEEPPDEQVDDIAKIRFMPDVFAAMRQARKLGFKLAMVTNQDGLGSETFPRENFDIPHRFMMDAFSSQGIEFDAVFVCPHRKSDGCECRKPKVKLVEELGSESFVHMELADGTLLTVRAARGRAITNGSLRAKADLSHALLFAPDGQRIRGRNEPRG